MSGMSAGVATGDGPVYGSEAAAHRQKKCSKRAVSAQSAQASDDAALIDGVSGTHARQIQTRYGAGSSGA